MTVDSVPSEAKGSGQRQGAGYQDACTMAKGIISHVFIGSVSSLRKRKPKQAGVEQVTVHKASGRLIAGFQLLILCAALTIE